MRGKICSPTTLEFICSIFTVFLAIAQPNTRNAVPTWTSKVALLAFLPMRNWNIQQNQVSPVGILDEWSHYLLLSSVWISCSTAIIISENEISLKSFLIEAGFLDVPLKARAKCASLSLLTLAIGFVSIVSAIICTITDPWWMDAQWGGVAADEIFFFHSQLVKVRAFCVVWIQNTINALSQWHR